MPSTQDDLHAGLCGCASCCGSLAAFTFDASAPAASLASASVTGVDINALLAGSEYVWSSRMGAPLTLTYSFMAAPPSYGSGRQLSTFQPFTETMKAGARTAFAEFSEVSGLTFAEVADAGEGAQIRFATSEQPGPRAGYAYYPGTGQADGDVWLDNTEPQTLDLTPGTWGFQVLLHEIGHAIGLKHPGNYSSSYFCPDDLGPGPFVPASLDNTFFSVMSYHPGMADPAADLGPLDIEALRHLYGPGSTGSSSGIFSGTAAADQYTGTDGRNYALGLEGEDVFVLQGGNDLAIAGGGADTLSGGSGADTLYGNIGTDFVMGGDGNDVLFGGQNAGALTTGGTVVLAYRDGVEIISGGAGDDAVYGNIGSDLLYGDLGNDSIFGGQEGDLLLGGAGNDVLQGNLGGDTIVGGDGADTLYGGPGDDHLAGGAGADVFRFWEPVFGADVVADFNPAEGDRLSIAYGGQTVFSQGPQGMMVATGAGQITLMGVDSSSVSNSWFV